MGHAALSLALSATLVTAPAPAQEAAGELGAPRRLAADGAPIDIGEVYSIAHAGPWLEDVDGDGHRDLLVGAFDGNFWFFRNAGSDADPRYTNEGKLQAGGVAAETPIY